MSEPAIAFVSHVRRGIGAKTLAPAGARASVVVGVDLNAGAVHANATLDLVGAGDVVGIDARAVQRVWPRPGVYDATSNYLALLEFDQADLPWRYTPGPADANGHLLPWVGLVVLRDDEIDAKTFPDSQHPLGSIRVHSPASLPPHGQLWAWAHAQVVGNKNPTASDVAGLLAREPRRVLSRLICPRRLETRTHYTGYLVPTLERGRLAGLGLDVPDTVGALDPAWPDPVPAAAAPVELPIYYEWRFATADEADFEALVRRLDKRPVTSGGSRELDVSAPGRGRVAAAAGRLAVESALRLPGASASAWTLAWTLDEKRAWVASLKQLVETPGRVAPPLYGRWHARQGVLDAPPEDGSPWPWFDEVNSDPGLRVVAGVGGRVVQRLQEQLMAGAWKQVAGIRELNAELRLAQLARETACRAHARHLAADDPEVALPLTAPVHSHVRTAAGAALTVAGRVAASPIASLLAPQWRRMVRRLGSLGRRLGRLATSRSATILTRLNDGTLKIAPPPPTPAAMARLDAAPLTPHGSLTTGPGGEPDFRAREYQAEEQSVWTPPPAVPPLTNRGPDSPSAAAFRAALAAAWPGLTATPAPLTAAPLDLQALRQRVVAELDPATTIADSYRARMKLSPALAQTWRPLDPLEPVLAAPSFPQPMVEPLRDLSIDWLFSGLTAVQPNSVSVLETNRRFVNAYMLGLNHQMARELLWAGYPTDQRGTYFRTFWDGANLIDIDPIVDWPMRPATALEDAGKATGHADRLVLVLRGDLLARYPNVLIYAAPGKATGPDPTQPANRVPDTTPALERQPVFGATAKLDVTFLAFDLTRDAARGDDPKTPAGWYFVIEEQATERRFGLNADSAADGVSTWDDLAWTDLPGSTPGAHLDLVANAPPANRTPPAAGAGGATWGRAAADMAFIVLQHQVRLAIHASDLIEHA